MKPWPSGCLSTGRRQAGEPPRFRARKASTCRLPPRAARWACSAWFPRAPRKPWTSEQLHLLEAFAGLIALAFERADLEAEADRIRLDIETERLRSSLLSAVSHDLRTPLSVITGASSTLLENDQSLDPKVRRELAASILDESERLNRLVANLSGHDPLAGRGLGGARSSGSRSRK